MSTLSLGYAIPEILFPQKGTDLSLWSVVACDQYTSQEDYWNQVEDQVGEAPSTLRLMLPEVWLKDAQREASVAPVMERYLAEGILRQMKPGMIRICRRTTQGVRRGLLLMVDLEAYDYSPDAKSLIRATEATVTERLPARVRVREKAAIEMPHIMVLVDDIEHRLDRLLSVTEKAEPLYHFPLMMDSGEITGWQVEEDAQEAIEEVFLGLCREQGEGPMVFAVGDGNHSLAAAKVFWNQVKEGLSCEERLTHPARFALAEIVNIHDEALHFEPIHRVVTGVDAARWMQEIADEMTAKFAPPEDPSQALIVELVTHGKRRVLFLDPQSCPLPLRPLQELLDQKLAQSPSAEQDYIHGREALEELSRREDTLGILVPAIRKDGFFSIIRSQGPLPRKCFSMGEAQDKRFYLECRALRKGQEVESWE